MSSIVSQKHCHTCNQVKPLSDFHKNAAREDGVCHECKECAKQRAKNWRDNNLEKARATTRRCQQQRKARGIRYVAPEDGEKHCNLCDQTKHVSAFNKNVTMPDGLRYCCRDCEKAKGIQWRTQNRERDRRTHRAWAARNKGKLKEKRAIYREKNREILREKNRIYGRQNPEKRREQVMRRNARKRQSTIAPVSYKRIWERDKGFCYLCGLRVDPNDCWYDHIIPLSKGGSHTESNIAVTHSWCNMKKSANIVTYHQPTLELEE